jgi:hypothetical protein
MYDIICSYSYTTSNTSSSTRTSLTKPTPLWCSSTCFKSRWIDDGRRDLGSRIATAGENSGLHRFPVDGHLRPPDDMKDMNIVGAIVDLGRWSHLETMHRFVGAKNMSVVNVARHRIMISEDHDQEVMMHTAKLTIGVSGMIHTNETSDA